MDHYYYALWPTHNLNRLNSIHLDRWRELMKNIFVSPSNQESNIGVSPFSTEEAEMNKIADILIPLLIKDGRFNVKRNDPTKDIYQAATDSNNFLADIHIAIHSNAGGGEGTEVWAYGSGTNSERLSQCLYKHVAPLSPGKDRGVKFNSAFVEIGNRVNASSSLIEVGFHDNQADATWIANNYRAIARALYKGICDYYGYDYPALVAEPPTEAPVAPVTKIHPNDIYLSARVLDHLADQAIKDINKLGFACKRLDLA